DEELVACREQVSFGAVAGDGEIVEELSVPRAGSKLRTGADPVLLEALGDLQMRVALRDRDADDGTRSEPSEALHEASRREPALEEVRSRRDADSRCEEAEIPREEPWPVDEP